MNWKTRKTWTEQEVATLRDLVTSHTHAQIAVRLHRPVKSIQHKAIALGLWKTRPWTTRDESLLRILHPRFRNVDIAAYLGVTLNRVRNAAQHLKLHKHGVRPPAASAEIIRALVEVLKA